MTKSAIEWTEQTWNPIVGCSIVSPGCTNCYAMKMAARIEAMGNQPRYAGTTKKVNGNAIWTGKLAQAPEATLLEPLRRKKPTTYFVNSMGDLFHEDCPDEWIDRVFAVMALSPQHTFQVLTKRAKRMRHYCSSPRSWTRDWEAKAALIVLGFSSGGLDSMWPLPNVWLGVSTERQQEADERIPHLLQTPAAIRFISAEPLLDAINISDYLVETARTNRDSYLNWVICGGESGPGARMMEPEWAEELRDQCDEGGAGFFMKQMTGKRPIPRNLLIRESPRFLG